MTYKRIQDSLITGIKKFKDVVPDVDHFFVPELSVDEQPTRPFFTFAVVDDYQRVTFHDYENEPWVMKYQLKSHADSDIEAKDMAFSLRKLLESQQLQYDLAQIGIGINSVDPMPPLNETFSTRIEYASGIYVSLMVNDSYTDPTQPGQIEDLSISTKFKKEGN